MNVYIFKCSDGTYKIGKANDITQRKPQVEKEFSIKAETYAWKPIADTLEFEKMLHRKFKHHRAHHEFFNLTTEQVDEIVQKYCFTLSVNTVKSKSEGINKDPIHAKYNEIIFELEATIADKDAFISKLRNDFNVKLDEEYKKYKKSISEVIAERDAQGKLLVVKEESNKHLNTLANARFDVISALQNQIKSAEAKRFIEDLETRLSKMQLQGSWHFVLAMVSATALIVVLQFGGMMEHQVMSLLLYISTFFTYYYFISSFVKSHKANRLKLTMTLAKPYEIRTDDDKYMLLNKAWKKDSRAKRLKRFLPYMSALILHLICALFAFAGIMSFMFCFTDFSINIIAYTISLCCMAYFLFMTYIKFKDKVDKKAGVLSFRQFNEISTEESVQLLLSK